MSYNLAAGAILQVNWEGRLHEQKVMNTFHYRTETELTDAEGTLPVLAESFATVVWDFIAAAISTDVGNARISIQAIHPARFRKLYFQPAITAGLVVGEAEVSGAAFVLQRFGDAANRKNQGRIFVPGIAKSDTVDSRVSAAWGILNEGPLEAAMKASLLIGAVITAKPVIWSPANAMTPVPITSSNLSEILRYQRRREIGKGE